MAQHDGTRQPAPHAPAERATCRRLVAHHRVADLARRLHLAVWLTALGGFLLVVALPLATVSAAACIGALVLGVTLVPLGGWLARVERAREADLSSVDIDGLWDWDDVERGFRILFMQAERRRREHHE